jgi:hypothetical protein
MGVNLVAACCPNTPVDRDSFKDVVRVILGYVNPLPLNIYRRNGFLIADDVKSIAAEGNCHSFRLIFAERTWHIFASYFGGKIGSFVRFPGVNHEDWVCMDVISPIDSKDWIKTPGYILPVMNGFTVRWAGGGLVSPTIQLLDSKTKYDVEL